MEHCHQQLGEDNNHHNVVGAYDHGTHKRPQLLCVADAGDKERNVCQGEDVPEQGIAGPDKPVKCKKLIDVSGYLGNMSARCSSEFNPKIYSNDV